jgi:hypothetical protein
MRQWRVPKISPHHQCLDTNITSNYIPSRIHTHTHMHTHTHTYMCTHIHIHTHLVGSKRRSCVLVIKAHIHQRRDVCRKVCSLVLCMSVALGRCHLCLCGSTSYAHAQGCTHSHSHSLSHYLSNMGMYTQMYTYTHTHTTLDHTQKVPYPRPCAAWCLSLLFSVVYCLV